MKLSLLLIAVISVLFINQTEAQIVYRPEPSEWQKLVDGGQFIDRFLPMTGGILASNMWGAQDVLPRYIDNGIENDSISYWGGNIIKGDDGKYHFFLCGWPENNPDGHMGYIKYSTMYHALSDNSVGPFKVDRNLGEGHNTEVLKLSDGRYMVYNVIGDNYEKHCTYLISESLEEPWERKILPLDLRDRPVRLGGGHWFHNMSFAKREDGSVIMLSRCGSIWISKTGTSPYNLVTEKSIYPMVDGRFEDPVIWRDHIQYHAIVNDWIGRTAFYLRSKDGINWVVDPGQAYAPGIAIHNDGRKENWYKYERIRILQDEYGRAIQANFAVIDTLKHFDLPNDKYSSKNIGIPLNPGLLLSMENKLPFNHLTKEIKVRISAEEDFNPISDVDIESLRFGASSEVNYGRGAKPICTITEGEDLIVFFEGKNHCIDQNEFAPKMLGKNKNGKMIYGYAQLPWLNYIKPVLSARKPLLKDDKVFVVVENFGQVGSKETFISLSGFEANGTESEWGRAIIPALNPFERCEVEIIVTDKAQQAEGTPVLLRISSEINNPVLFYTIL